MLFKNITFRGKPIVTAEQIAERFYSHDTSLRFHNRLEKLMDWLMKKINEVKKMKGKRSGYRKKSSCLATRNTIKAHIYLAKKQGLKGESIADYEMEPEAIARLIVHQKLKPLRKRVRHSFHRFERDVQAAFC